MIRTLKERAIEIQKDLYLCFIDYTKAFDKLRHEEIMSILDSLNIDGKDLRIVRNIYWEQTAAMRIGNGLSAFQDIKRGVRQGCVLSPDLFSIYSEIIMRAIEGMPSIKVGGYNMNNIRYADDTVLIADNEKELQEMLDTVVRESKNKGLYLWIKRKPKSCMVISKKNCRGTCLRRPLGTRRPPRLFEKLESYCIKLASLITLYSVLIYCAKEKNCKISSRKDLQTER